MIKEDDQKRMKDRGEHAKGDPKKRGINREEKMGETRDRYITQKG
jgi:hypothetical protein